MFYSSNETAVERLLLWAPEYRQSFHPLLPMRRPDNVKDLLSLIRHSEVVEETRLDGFVALLHKAGLLEEPQPGSPASAGRKEPLAPNDVLGLMVEEGLLTRYQADELAAGRSGFWIGGYLLLDKLGRGGMGKVFLAEHVILQKRVAIKVLFCKPQDNVAARARFLREAQAAAAVNHSNVVRVFDVDTANDPPFLVMEYVDGISLQAAVARHGTFSACETAAVGLQVAEGLQQAAAVGLIHRDIKPANILIDRKGQVKILDLGIARFEGDPISCRLNTSFVLGTIDYLAPEQAENSSKVDTRADLYALGATLYFLLAGHPPFPEDNPKRKLALKQSADPTPLHELRPDVPMGLSDVVRRLLARSPSDRYPSPAETAAALKAWAPAGADFPGRLFQTQVAESSGVLTTIDQDDPNPTPPPPTRRILASQLERRRPDEANATPPLPSPAPPVTEKSGGEVPLAPPSSQLLSDNKPDEEGSPTVNLFPTEDRRKPRPGQVG